MNDAQLLRYSRHILLDELGIEGQQKLLASHALIIGAGGLGSPAALYLGSAGVGRITVVDPDTVDVTNLQRQIAHALTDVGRSKAQSIKQSIADINPDVAVTAITERADNERLDEWVRHADVVLDCTDNSPPDTPSTGHALRTENHWCRAQPFVLMDRSAFMTGAIRSHRAMRACFRNRVRLKKRNAPAWACFRRWSASLAAFRRLRR